MKKLLPYALLLCLILLLGLCQAVLAQEPLVLNRAEALELISVTPGLFIVDVRNPQEYAAAHVEGAVNIPRAEVEERLDEFPANRPILLYCASGKRAADSYDILRAKRPEITLVFRSAEGLL